MNNFFPTNESENIFVSSRGIMKSCNYYSIQPISSIKFIHNYPNFDIFIKKYISSNKIPIIYVCSSAIAKFILYYLNKIPFKFILVSGDCDEDIPNEIFASHKEYLNFINNDKLVHWYCQNFITLHKKITIIPIGLDYHTMQKTKIFWGPLTNSNNQEYLLQNIIKKSKPFYERKIKCYSNFHFTMNTKHGYDRKNAYTQIPTNLVYYEKNKVNRISTWMTQKNYAFVISPHGGGYDCHRTWEALVLGCIPIVKKSKIDNLYKDLPVLILDDWDQLNQELMETTIKEFKNMNFNMEKITLKYWVDKINNIVD